LELPQAIHSADAMGWKDLFETLYYVAGTIAAIGTLVAAVFALCVYRGNSRLERARWASTLYEKFFEKDHLRKFAHCLIAKLTQMRLIKP
jgi:hypothetical protein